MRKRQAGRGKRIEEGEAGGQKQGEFVQMKGKCEGGNGERIREAWEVKETRK